MTAFCFDDSPIIRSLFTSTAYPHPLSSLFFLQWEKLKWPIPDLIVSTAGDWFLGRRWKSLTSIAGSFASLLHKPYLPLYIDRFRLTNPLVSIERQSQTPKTESVYLRHPSQVVNTNILLIDGITESGQSLLVSAKALTNYGALEIRALGGISPY